METAMMKTYTRPDLVFVKGEGSNLYTETGESYLDFVAGVAVNALGHANPALVKTLTEQASKMMHCSNLYYNDQQIKLAERLVKLAGMNSVFFVNSGAEANEGALKIARKYGTSQSESKNTLLYLKNSFHGRTLGSLSVTGQPKYQKPFKPLLGGTRCVEEPTIEALKAAFDDSVCGLILEPIQGEGGVIPLSDEFLSCARELCDQYNSVLIFDEVQCGIGRTGNFYAWEGTPVKPDVITLAKGLGGGFPIGAVIANEKVDCLVPGDHGCTFGGNPLACAMGNTILDHIANPEFLQAVTDKSLKAIEKINENLKDNVGYKTVAGKGLLLGIHLNDLPASAVVAKALEQNLLLVSAGPNVVRLVPALNIDEKQWLDGVQKVCEIILSI